MSSCNDIRMSIGMPEFRNGWAKVNILGVNIHSIPLEGLIDTILLSCKDERKAIITYANIHALNLAYQIDYLCAFFNRCDVVFCDGIGVQWAAKFRSEERKAIITYANIHALNLAYQIDYLCAFFNRCDVVFCDGIGVQWAAKF